MLSQDNYKTMLIDKRESGVAVVTLNRPERLNAVNGQMHHELSTFARDADSDNDVKVVVLAGEGRAFCAGGDFSGDREGGPSMTAEEARQIVDHILEMRKPIVSAVQGYAMGLGSTISLLCDVVVAGQSTVFADTHVKLGIGAGDGGGVIWPLLMGVNRAKWHLMTGDRVTGQDLMDSGLVNFLVDDEEILDKAISCAEQLAAGPLKAIMASKVPVNNYIRFVSSMVLPLSLSMEFATMSSDDAKEAGKAFQEKREPKFTGH
ncbi:MAG: enoyl-CoA hydratase [Actinomycetia bacterium]|nr:enoyl-CoA hydratase [Actinomycetes bacterium]MCP5033102.1 enoyl-CoA hydratase [Actinomycetes bacterium]